MKPKAPTRDSVTTINEDGSRYFVHPADVTGMWTTLRRLAGVALIAVFIALPIVKINGEPAVFLDVFHRKLHLFGLTFLFQDLWLLFFLITGTGFALFLITALVGRVWCGWACPQTVFLEHVFRRIERFIEGDGPARRALDDAPWTGGKLIKRFVKHGAFFAVSAGVAHLFVSYFVSIPTLYAMAHRSPLENFGVFVFVFALSAILYFNFAWFREQFCIVLCPYGRLQSALIDDNSIVVGYDEVRGEPRGKAGATTGDCIDCRRCVQVCPTGIDIRQGLQLECISCAACIDACDAIMDKLGRKRGLVRHDSLNALRGRPFRFWRPRLYFYTAVLVVGAIVFGFATTQVKPVVLSALRMQGAPYFRDGDMLRNNFLLRVANKRNADFTYTLTIASPVEGLVVANGNPQSLALGPNGEVQEPLILSLPAAKFDRQFDVTVRILGQGGAVEAERKVPFLGPFRE